MGRVNMTSLVSGVLFVALGVLFLLDRLGVIALSAGFVWPLLLIGLGVAVLAGGRRHRDDRPVRPEPASSDRPGPEDTAH